MSIVEQIPPVGQPSWVAIAAQFEIWALANGRPLRDDDALHKKYSKILSSKPTGVGGPSPLQQRFQAVESKTHEVAGGAILHDGHASDADSGLDENMVTDALAEVDGIETRRTLTFFILDLTFIGTKSRGFQTLERLSKATTPSEETSGSSTPETPRRRRSPDFYTVCLQQQQRADARWESFVKLHAIDQEAQRVRLIASLPQFKPPAKE